MPAPLRIAQLISSGGFYGAENMLANLLDALHQLNVEVSLYVLDNTHNSHQEIAVRARDLAIPVTIIPCHGRIDASATKALRTALHADGISVLHTHGYKADLYGFWAARSSAIKLVSTCHNWTKASPALRLYCLLDKRALRRFDRVVAVSAQVEQELLRSGLRPATVSTISNGVAISPTRTKRIHIHGPDGLTIGMATRLVEEKGIADFLEVASTLVPTYPGLRLLIAGDGLLRARFEAQAAHLGLTQQIAFLGFVADMKSFYASLDIFALPSLREGLPMSLLEAMADGNAVIASRVGAIPSVVAHELSGLLIEPGDTAALAVATKRLLEDSALRLQLGVRARQAVEDSYSSLAMAKLYLSLYRETHTRRTSNATTPETSATPKLSESPEPGALKGVRPS